MVFEEIIKRKLGNTDQVSCEVFTDVLCSAIEEHCPSRKCPMKAWINAECLELIEKRREAKKQGIHSNEYRQLNRAVRRAWKKAKEEYFLGIACEAEIAFRKGDSRKVFETVKRLSSKSTAKSGLGVKGRIVL